MVAAVSTFSMPEKAMILSPAAKVTINFMAMLEKISSLAISATII